MSLFGAPKVNSEECFYRSAGWSAGIGHNTERVKYGAALHNVFRIVIECICPKSISVSQFSVYLQQKVPFRLACLFCLNLCRTEGNSIIYYQNKQVYH
jgi:hypothetical protein